MILDVEVVEMDEMLAGTYDVVVVGGGAAGLSGALMLARVRRSVLVVDAGLPRNAPADGVHGLLARDGMPPGELLARGRTEVSGYGGHVVDGEVAEIVRRPDGFDVHLVDGRVVGARRLLVATGLVDQLPDIPGLRERWGREVVHCPYCHGWEVRDRAIGVLACGPMATHQALLFRQLSADVTMFSNDQQLGAEDRERLAARGVPVVDGPVESVQVVGDAVVGLRMGDGVLVERDVIAVQSRMVARGRVLTGLGVRPSPHPSGVGEYFPAVDPSGRTEAPGVWLAGNVTDLSAQVGAAAASGALAGAMINIDLVTAETDAARAALRAGVLAGATAAG